MNQGEFYVYSPDGGIDGVDTVKVEAGRFSYEIPCQDHFTLIIVFPNFSEQPIFAESGKTVDIKADVSHLKELTVTGTKTNELMNKFREQIVSVSPPEEKQLAEQFIKDHLDSEVALFLTKKYFITQPNPDYKKAATLLQAIAKEQPDNQRLLQLLSHTLPLGNTTVGSALPAFTAYDVNGNLVSSAELASSPVTVITTWSGNVYDSQDLQRELKRRQRSSKGRLKLLSICVDASKYDCKRNLQRDSISWPNICSGDMMADKTLQKLGMTAIPDNIVLQNGKVVARSLKKQELYAKLDMLLR